MESLVVFVKSPLLGSVKTRLAKERGDADAMTLYAGFLEDVFAMAAGWRKERVAVDPNRRLVLYAAPHTDDPVLFELARRAGARLEVQPEGDLGARLKTAFDREFDRGARAVCAIGSDSPTLPLHLVDHAFRALLWNRVALGPTFDGGYWLVGAQRPAPDLFSDIPWSTPAVLARTLTKLRAQEIDGYLLPFWYDVDEAGDLERLVWHVRSLRAQDPNACAGTWASLQKIGVVRTPTSGAGS